MFDNSEACYGVFPRSRMVESGLHFDTPEGSLHDPLRRIMRGIGIVIIFF